MDISKGGHESASADPMVAGADSIFGRVFVPVDYSMGSHLAVGVALDLQRTHGSAVCLFHATESAGSDEWLGGIGSPAVGGDWVSEEEGRLRRFLQNIAPWAPPSVEVRAIVGEFLPAVRRAAEEWNATVVVIAASVSPEFLRSPAERLIHRFQVPTLVIPS